MTKLECPVCGEANDIFTVHGTIVTGEVSVRVGTNGRIQAIGPIKPHMLLKPGKELNGKYMLTCPSCGNFARSTSFNAVMISILSGVTTQDTIYIPWLDTSIPITVDEKEAALSIFHPGVENSWNDSQVVLTILG